MRILDKMRCSGFCDLR